MKLKTAKKEYLIVFYQFKKCQFIKTYIKQYFNFNVHFIQQNKNYHMMIKTVMH